MLSKHLLAYLLPNLSQVIASFGTVFVLTRFLNEAQYGHFNEVFTIMSILHYVFLTWIEAAAGRFFANAREEENTKNHFYTIFIAYFANCALFFLFAILILYNYPTYASTHLALSAAFGGSIIRSLLKIALETRRMDLQAMRYAMVESLHILIGFILSVAAVIFFGLKQEAPFIATLIAAICALMLELPHLLKAARGGNFNFEMTKSYFFFGFPISLNLIMAALLGTGDRLIIGPILGATQVGIYSAGYQVAARILDTFFAYASSATFPLLVNAYESKDEKRFEKTANENFALRFGLGAPVAIGIALVAAPLCEILIGEDMRAEATRIAPYIAFGGLLLGLSDYFSDAFMLSKRVFERTILLIFPVIVNIGLNIILLPKIGINGAIIATIASYGLALILMLVMGRRHVKLPIPLDQILKISIALALMSAIVMAMPRLGGFLELMIKGVVGAIIYFISAYFLDIANVRILTQKILKKTTGGTQ